MSDALAYLAKARPEAMGHYFSFLKDCGSRLDPKTRNLISVITKVHAQTERGLRQYLRRALREGCSREEVLDALLMAFPALGLAKIVWAVDVMLAMDPPPAEAPAQAPAAPAWHDLMAADLPPGQTRRIECAGRAVFVHRAADGWRVFDSRCPHQATDITELGLAGDTLTCPRHGWQFELAGGRCTAEGDRPLRQWDSRVVEGRLQAHW
ncbi:Rieske 2Fe-2S domain-containing protein [Caenimonas terrae]|uniref:Rieske 2Fe-2S domain-containing protein n=1 Tax=Caenimonas terrae TaxID=696074 RepID=A0ABW0N7Z0_9BURK